MPAMVRPFVHNSREKIKGIFTTMTNMNKGINAIVKSQECVSLQLFYCALDRAQRVGEYEEEEEAEEDDQSHYR